MSLTLEEDGRALFEGERAALRTVVDAEGLAGASLLLKISESPITRALAGLPITRASVAKLRAAMQKKGYLPCPPTP